MRLAIGVLLLEWLLLPHLIPLQLSLLIDMLLLAEGLSSCEGHALARHLTLLLSSSTLHEQALHHLALAGVNKSACAIVTGGERPLAHLLLHLLWLGLLLILLLRGVGLLAVLPLERLLRHLQALIELIVTMLTQLLVLLIKLIGEIVGVL